ncbi:hypothetical protein [Kitasatospora brasiliensis]|uniref:hypothetical protein n=1 Tax=Kitasatospora brasiliensis TaxID=3058040 RepID=UPI00292D8383|nr:hypothetical protein [Kitasatospora sp. K002]
MDRVQRPFTRRAVLGALALGAGTAAGAGPALADTPPPRHPGTAPAPARAHRFLPPGRDRDPPVRPRPYRRLGPHAAAA